MKLRTLGVAVLCGYAALFVLLLGVGALLMKAVSSKTTPTTPPDSAHTRRSPGSAAIGTVAGALGSKLENIDKVRHATYGHNQCRRRESTGSER